MPVKRHRSFRFMSKPIIWFVWPSWIQHFSLESRAIPNTLYSASPGATLVSEYVIRLHVHLSLANFAAVSRSVDEFTVGCQHDSMHGALEIEDVFGELVGVIEFESGFELPHQQRAVVVVEIRQRVRLYLFFIFSLQEVPALYDVVLHFLCFLQKPVLYIIRVVLEISQKHLG
jgi:hypothetical protein